MKKILLKLIFMQILFLSLIQAEKAEFSKKSKIGSFKIWKHKNGDFYVEKLDKKLNVMLIEASGSDVGLMEIKNIKGAKNIKMLLYYAGSSGTSAEIHHLRAALWSESKNAFIGDYLYEDRASKTSKPLIKTKFLVINGKLNVTQNRKLLYSYDLK